MLAILALIAGLVILHLRNSRPQPLPVSHVRQVSKQAPTPVATPCNGIQDKTIIVSITQRHLWACAEGKRAYDSPVVTGYMGDPSNLTPVGTYKIYAKQTDQYLTGTDDLGSWNDYVHYWMPFLDNQYGAYGFHDATWRSDSAFGNIDPNSKDASHGCVELPLATAKWLYDWSSVGTTVIVRA